jgi:hypothetical protein
MKIDEIRDFGTRECPSCAVEVPANQNHCLICGYAFPHPTPWQRHMKFWLALLMIFLLLFFLLAGLL